MKKVNVSSVLLGILCLASTAVYAVEVEGTPTPELTGGDWQAAGAEISEAARGAVGDATAESSKQAWESSKKGSAEAWEATKRQSKTVWEDGKAKLHEATAPDGEVAPAE